MRIAFFVYPSAFQNKGGGEILLEKTEEYLLKRDIEVKRFDIWNDRVEDYDILHVFGSVKECLPLMRVASERGVKVALESIFWSDMKRAFHESGSFTRKAGMILRHSAKVAFPFFPSARRDMFLLADIIFPNSEGEGKQISRLFGVPLKKMFPVPNGVDSVFSHADPAPFSSEYGLDRFVLSAGRIEPRKNQLNLIRAMRNVEVPLVLIGDTVSGYEWYRDQCVSEARSDTVFTGRMEHGSEMMRSAYASCDTFVLPAWFETPGLAALEAGLAGAKVVATRGGSTGEYFEDKVRYTDPSDIHDMEKQIKASLSSPADGRLRDLIKERYQWDKVAERRIEGYRRMLSRG
jgi:glycosyltransferase involved in cell wall biosynthesis